jgi:hypothetical protein
MSNEQVVLGVSQLKELSETAKRIGTQNHFIDVVMQWATAAADRIEELEAFKREVIAEVTNNPAGASIELQAVIEKRRNQ